MVSDVLILSLWVRFLLEEDLMVVVLVAVHLE
jgi:hypothetical protein